MGKKLKKNSFVEGTAAAYAAIIVTKLIGAVYSIPFYNMIGERGGVIYSCAYNIYALFLDISTLGIPVAVSIVISEFNTKKMFKSKDQSYSVALRMVAVLALASFLILQVFANQIGVFFLDDMKNGVSVDDIALGIRCISLCLLVVPFLSVKRGYLQGHKYIAASTQSQIIEQLVRIAVVLGGTYVVMYICNMSSTVGVCVALFGAAVGAGAAYMYLSLKSRASKDDLHPAADPDEQVERRSVTLRRIISYCVTIVITSISINLYNIVDMKMLLTGLHLIGMPDHDTQVISSIASTWIPKICMIITALSMGLSNSIAPHMAESRSSGDKKGMNLRLNQALGSIILVSLPIGIGMIMLAEPVFRLFYGTSLYGASLLQLAVIVTIVSGMGTVTGMAMQSIGKGKSVCVITAIGIVLNASLDLPLIFLFNNVGLPPYLGATTASIIGQSITVAVLLLSLRRSYRFSYMPVLDVLLRTIPGLAAMMLAVFLLSLVWPVVPSRGVQLVVQLALYAVIGGGVYAVLSFACGAVKRVLGQESLDKILRKLHLKKR